MTDLPSPAAFPERPPSEAEWEELLVRLDVFPRAARAALDDAGPGGAAAVRQVLEMMLVREGWLRDALEALRTAAPVPAGFSGSVPRGLDAGALLERLAALRASNFAAVQRRGLEVWEWRSADEEGGALTAYRLLSFAAAADGAALADLREAAKGAGAC